GILRLAGLVSSLTYRRIREAQRLGQILPHVATKPQNFQSVCKRPQGLQGTGQALGSAGYSTGGHGSRADFVTIATLESQAATYTGPGIKNQAQTQHQLLSATPKPNWVNQVFNRGESAWPWAGSTR